MPKSSHLSESLPLEIAQSLSKLGEHLSLARKRRDASQRDWALRLGVSVPTLMRMERGDETVSMAVYATALWMMGRVQSLSEIADPKLDLGALDAEIRRHV